MAMNFLGLGVDYPKPRNERRLEDILPGLGYAMLRGTIDPIALAARGDVPQGAGGWADYLSSMVPGAGAFKAAVPAALGLGGMVGRVAKVTPSTPERMAGAPGQISTRFPTAVAATEDPLAGDLLVGLGSAMRDPTAFSHNLGLMQQYPGYRRTGVRNPSSIANQIIDFQQQNLDWLWNQYDPALRERARKWYEGANRMVREASQQYNLTPETVSGVYAALSPKKDWFQNVSLGDRMFDMWTNLQGHRFDSSMGKVLDALTATSKNPVLKASAERIRGKTLGELSDPVDQGMWMQAFDRAHGDPSYRVITPEGARGDIALTGEGRPQTRVWQSTPAMAAASSMLADPSIENISRRLGGMHKVRNFYNNIFAPFSPRGETTIDTHAVAAANLMPWGQKAEEVGHNFGGGIKGRPGPSSSSIIGNMGTYGINMEPVQRVAAQQGVLPREVQSVTWEAIRGLFDNKSKPVKDAAERVWAQFRSGKISQEQAQRDIFDLAGGINEPAWK